MVWFFLLLSIYHTHFCPPDFQLWGMYKLSNYGQLLEIFNEHENFIFHPKIIAILYFALSVLWVVCAQGKKKIWGLLLLMLTFLALVKWFGIGTCNSSLLENLKSQFVNGKTYHLFKEDTYFHGDDHFYRLHLAACQKEKDDCIYQQVTSERFALGNVDWSFDEKFIKITLNGQVIGQYSLGTLTPAQDDKSPGGGEE